VTFSATASTACPNGVAAMGIYTAPFRRVYTQSGAKLNTTLKLAPGTYDIVVQQWDRCRGTAKAHIPLVVEAPRQTPPPVDPLPPTTSLGKQVQNNTSTADAFAKQPNGNLGAGNVSKVDIRTLLYPGSTTEIFAEIQPWFGDRRHMQVGYISWETAQVEKQLNDMLSRGITGVIIDWYGPADITEPTTLAWKAAAENHPGFKFLIMIDKGAIRLSPCKGCNPQQTMVYLTNYVLEHYANSPAYATWNGKPVITQFDIDEFYKLDWHAIQAKTSPNIAWIFQHSEGFNHPVTSGSYSWMNATSKQFGMDYLTKFYNQAARTQQHMAWGAGYKGFNDTLASWSLQRVVGQNCGQTWLQSFDKLNSYYNSTNQLPLLQLVTWNDYEEGTELESGIDNCLTVSAKISGSQLQWDVNGNENTVNHYVVYFSADGDGLRELNTVPAGTRAMDLGPFNLRSGQVFVQAIGKPSIKNQMSAAVKTPW
jgi:hypothetical protein